jgi:L-fucose isomerase-like protein
MKNINIGVVCLARKTFDFEEALKIYKKSIQDLELIDGINWSFIDDLVIEPSDAQKCGEILSARNLDGIVIISGTFHLGHLALIVDKHLRVPILLWGFNELPYNGGKIRLNSVCGVNLNASNLYKSGNDNYVCHIGDTIDTTWLNAVRMKAVLKNAHVGLAGYRADGFFNLSVEDTSLFKNTGVLIDHYELNSLMDENDIKDTGFSVTAIKDIFNCADINKSQVEKVSKLSSSIEGFMKSNKLDALAIRCWPEFANVFGISPCAAMSLLNAKGYTIGCEGDVEGTLSMLACNAISSLPAFLADLSQVNFEENYALMWHCGVAAYPLWDGKSVCSLDTYFAGGRGVTADFVMKSGEVTLMRIDSARGKTRLFIQKGMSIPMEKNLKGTYCKVVFHKTVRDLLDIVTTNGIAHHVSMVYGDHVDAMYAFARMMNFEVIS